MKNLFLSLVLAAFLTACSAPTQGPTMSDNTAGDMASGTQLAGTPMQTENADGETMIGGDAVAPDSELGQKSFTVIGSNYAYDLEDITVQEGDEVTINFRSNEGTHDFVIDELDVATDTITEGQETSVTFVADQTGTFEFYCSVGNHRAQGMVGTLTVE